MMLSHNWSMRRLLLVSVNLIVIAVLVITSWLTYRNTRYELGELFDAELAQTARLLTHLALHVDFDKVETLPIIVDTPFFPDLSDFATEHQVRELAGHAYESKIAFQVWDAQGHLLLTSANTFNNPLSQAHAGYHDMQFGHYHWITFSLPVPSKKYWIYTAQREDVRSELGGFIADDLLYPVLLTWVPITLLIFIVVNGSLRPVRRFSQKLEQRSPTQLEPMQQTLPKEIQPIQKAINHLFGQINDYVKRERRFVADASHELRTPLSVMRIHADNLLSGESEQERRQAALAVIAGTRRMSHLVNQLLAIARLDGRVDESLSMHAIDTESWVNDTLASLPGALLQRVNWQVKITDAGQLYGEPILLSSMLRNLLENAGKFAPDDSSVDIIISRQEQQTILRIANTGHHLTDEDIARLTERFYRHAAVQNVEGSGLGLSIVQRIIELHHGTLQFAPLAAGGLAVEVSLPAQ